MSTALYLATASADLHERFQLAAGGRDLTLFQGALPSHPAELVARSAITSLPDVVAIDAHQRSQEALNLAGLIERHYPQVSVVLVSDIGSDLSLDAMRVGIRDILHPAAELSEVQAVVERAAQAAQVRRALAASEGPGGGSGPARSRVISVVSPKGGVGKTTVSTNLAVGLARTAPGATVLVDLDIQFGDVASALNLEPEYFLPDTLTGSAARDTMVLKTFLTLHKTGLYVICGPETPAAADSVSAEQVSRLLQMLASEFEYVVVDTAPGLSEHTLAAMDQSTDLVLLTSMDVPGVRGLRKELDTLTELNLLNDSGHIVLNFADTRGGLTVADIEATIGTKVHLTIPRSKAAPLSVNQGVPLLQSEVKDPMTRQLQQLVGRFAPTPAVRTRSLPTIRTRSLIAKERGVEPAPRRAKSRWRLPRRVVA
jgi:pilus assembly protein CpaE